MKKKIKTAFWILLTLGISIGIWTCWKKYKIFQQQELTKVMTVQDKKFDYDQLLNMAQKLAQKPYIAPQNNLPEEITKLNYDQHRDIRFIRENGPWFGQKLPFEVQFFHLGSLFLTSVPINEIVDNHVHPLSYSPNYFNYGKNTLDLGKLSKIGYAGFRLHNPLNTKKYYDELVSFLGASYFRALGKGQKYGLSARGLAIDTAVQTGEEFPIFREFWLVRPKKMINLLQFMLYSTVPVQRECILL